MNEYTGNPAFWAGVIVGALLVVAYAVASFRAARAADDEAAQDEEDWEAGSVDTAAQVEAAGNEGPLYGGQL